jgi:tryptophanyl-tRNA synthetase
MKLTILTGDRPTGPLHLGHYVGSLKNRVVFQDDYRQFIMIADAQAFTDNFDQAQKVRDNVVQVALDYLAVGLDPSQNIFFIQSQIPELCELSYYFMNLVTVARLQRNPTIKEEIKQKGFGESIPVGFFCYPISQAADILGFNTDAVPVGEDQNPMIELTNEIARRFNSIYEVNCFKEVRSIVGSIGRLPGIDGKTKMSKSLGNAIFLSDSTDEIRRKVNLMFTDPNHLKVADPGTVEGNVVFMFLDFFDPNKEELSELKAHYRRGGLGDGQTKKRLVEILDNLISPIRARRQQYETDIPYVKSLLKEGSHTARALVSQKVTEAKEAMKLIY